MWFGVAPAPAPSPRTNAKAWHPPHCTCAKHSSSDSSAAANFHRQSHGTTASSPRRLVSLPDDQTYQPHNSSTHHQHSSSPRHHRSSSRKAQHASSPTHHRSKEDAVRSPVRDVGAAAVPRENSRTLGEDDFGNSPHVRRLSRRLSKQTEPQSDDWSNRSDDLDPTARMRPEKETTASREESGSSSSVTLDNTSPAVPARPRTRTGSRNGMATGVPHDSAFRYGLFSRGGDSRLPTPSSSVALPAIPAPTKSRRGSRGASRSRESIYRPRVYDDVVPPPPTLSLSQSDACVCLSPPMVERAQPTNLVGHTSSVGTVLVDDNSFIVSCSIDGSVKVWSRTSLDCLYTLYGHEDTVSCVDLSSQWLVSGSHDMTLRVYESSHGFRFAHSLQGHSGHVTRVAILPNSDLVLSGSDDTSLRVWDLQRGQCLAVFGSHTSRVTCLLVLRGPQNVPAFCSGSADATVCFWDLSRISTATTTTKSISGYTGFTEPLYLASRRSFHIHKATVQCLLSAGAGAGSGSRGMEEIVFSCSNDGTIQWFDAATLHHLGCVDAVQSPVYSMAFHATLGHLVCSTGDGRILVYSDWKTCIAKKELKVSPKWISSLQLLRGRLLACASEDDLYVVNLERPRIERVLATAHGFLNGVRWLQKNERLATCGEDNVVKIWPIF